MSNILVRDHRKPGHHWADNEVMDEYCKIIGMQGYAIYMYLCRWAGNRTGRCSKRQSEIAETFNSSQDTVQRHLGKLEECGLISIQNIVGMASIYTILEVGKLPQNAATSLPQNAATLPQNAADLPQNAAHNKEERLFQDYINTNSIPEWLKSDIWNDFKAMRKKIRKPMTERAEKLVIKKLNDLRSHGHPPEKVLERSIINCWQDVFELPESNGQQNSKAERRSTDIRESTSRVFDAARSILANGAGRLQEQDVRSGAEALDSKSNRGQRQLLTTGNNDGIGSFGKKPTKI